MKAEKKNKGNGDDIFEKYGKIMTVEERKRFRKNITFG